MPAKAGIHAAVGANCGDGMDPSLRWGDGYRSWLTSFLPSPFTTTGEEDPTMMGLLIFAAAAGNAPVILASADDAQWRMFVRASLERTSPPQRSRLRQLQGAVRALGDDRRGVQVAGPSGL
jgi:hypothetical protein